MRLNCTAGRQGALRCPPPAPARPIASRQRQRRQLQHHMQQRAWLYLAYCCPHTPYHLVPAPLPPPATHARHPHRRSHPAACLPAACPLSACRVWVYTLVNTDYGGNRLLPHFLNYYHAHGITWRRFLVVLHHTPGKYSRRGLEDAMGICSGYAVECRWVRGDAVQGAGGRGQGLARRQLPCRVPGPPH